MATLCVLCNQSLNRDSDDSLELPSGGWTHGICVCRLAATLQGEWEVQTASEAAYVERNYDSIERAKAVRLRALRRAGTH